MTCQLGSAIGFPAMDWRWVQSDVFVWKINGLFSLYTEMHSSVFMVAIQTRFYCMVPLNIATDVKPNHEDINKIGQGEVDYLWLSIFVMIKRNYKEVSRTAKFYTSF